MATNHLNIKKMTALEKVLKELQSSKSQKGFDAVQNLFTILKSGPKDRNQLKKEMWLERIKIEFKNLEPDLSKKEVLTKVQELYVTSRNSIDTLISKNNSKFLFENIKGQETTKIILTNGLFRLSK